MNEVLRQLGTKQENFTLLLTDAARHMSLAGKAINELYPTLMHMSLALHTYYITLLCEFVLSLKIYSWRSGLKKAATIKSKDRKNDFREAGLPSPPVPVITRWATWLRAALYYSKNLPAVPTIVNNKTGEGLLVSRAKEVINEDGLVPDLVCINQYRTLATNFEQY